MSDVFFYPSPQEASFFDDLDAISKTFPHSLRHYLDLFTVYCSRRSFLRFLAHYEIFKMTIDLPGHILECGVYYGKSFFTWHKFCEILIPTATHKKVIGFDTFEGFPDIGEKDGVVDPEIQKHVGGLDSSDFFAEFEKLLDLMNKDCVLDSKRSYIIKGDIRVTFPEWLQDNPEARFSLVNLDLDLYEPTLLILEKAWDRLVLGGILILDEYATSKWEGETKAWDDFANTRGISTPVHKFPWSNSPGGYIVKV